MHYILASLDKLHNVYIQNIIYYLKRYKIFILYKLLNLCFKY